MTLFQVPFNTHLQIFKIRNKHNICKEVARAEQRQTYVAQGNKWGPKWPYEAIQGYIVQYGSIPGTRSYKAILDDMG